MLLYEITENQYEFVRILMYSVKHFLIKKNKYVELITPQAVFELISKGCDPDDTNMDELRRIRIPFKPSSMTIRDAFDYMIEKVPSVRWINRRTSR